MTLRSSARLAAILALAALPACAADLAPPAAAQQHVAQAGPGPMGPEGHRFHHRHHGPGGAMFAPEHIEGRLAFLKTELKITDAQLPQWNAFANAMRVQAKDAAARRAERHAAHHQPGQAEPRGERREAKPLPERMAAMERMMQAHLARLQQMRGAVEPLYGVLSPEQRKTADTLLLRG